MRRITVLKVLAVVLLLLGPAPVSAATHPEDEKTTVSLIGEDGKGNFTILLKQTKTNTNDFVFIMDLAVSSNYDYEGCKQERDPTDSRPVEIQLFCARDLWVAILVPDSRLFFLELGPGPSLSVQFAGSLVTFPFLDFEVNPYLTLGATIPFPPRTPHQTLPLAREFVWYDPSGRQQSPAR